jgi:hypothetical protein
MNGPHYFTSETEARALAGRLMRRQGGAAYLHNPIRVPVLDQHGRPLFDQRGELEQHEVPDRRAIAYEARDYGGGKWGVVERWRSHPQAPCPHSHGGTLLLLATCALLLAPPPKAKAAKAAAPAA